MLQDEFNFQNNARSSESSLFQATIIREPARRENRWLVQSRASRQKEREGERQRVQTFIPRGVVRERVTYRCTVKRDVLRYQGPSLVENGSRLRNRDDTKKLPSVSVNKRGLKLKFDCLPATTCLPRLSALHCRVGRTWKLLGCCPPPLFACRPAIREFLMSVCARVPQPRLKTSPDRLRKFEGRGTGQGDRPNFRSHDRITSCRGIPNERAARRAAVIRWRESNRRICCFRGRKFVRLPVIMSR